MAKSKYLSVDPIPGKFYVSQSWKADSTAGDGILSQFQHGNQLAEMILAGPFDTRGEAERWNISNAKGQAEIWQL